VTVATLVDDNLGLQAASIDAAALLQGTWCRGP
jgi:hypothetical protein